MTFLISATDSKPLWRKPTGTVHEHSCWGVGLCMSELLFLCDIIHRFFLQEMVSCLVSVTPGPLGSFSCLFLATSLHSLPFLRARLPQLELLLVCRCHQQFHLKSLQSGRLTLYSPFLSLFSYLCSLPRWVFILGGLCQEGGKLKASLATG